MKEIEQIKLVKLIMKHCTIIKEGREKELVIDDVMELAEEIDKYYKKKLM